MFLEANMEMKMKSLLKHGRILSMSKKLFPIFIAQPSRDTASECGTGLVIGSWDDEKNTVGLA